VAAPPFPSSFALYTEHESEQRANGEDDEISNHGMTEEESIG